MAEVVQLIGLAYITGGDRDVIEAAEPRETFAEKKSIRQSEYYQAFANSLRPTATFVIWLEEYRGENRLIHRDIAYEIIRTYEAGNRRIELVCQALDDVQTNLSRMRDEVEIWHNEMVENEIDEQMPHATRLCIVPASIEHKGGGSAEGDGVIETTTLLTVIIRYREGITLDMFLMIDGSRYDIRYIEDPYNRHHTLVLTVERVVP
ncbi:phage head closure protein [Paenibacillus aurantiacus]|uniref:Phage head closure protein n=1 Tax=Paenibacillus aurantiacus TaxID=1936118 RepID=A0ABV5KP45_9BACL